MSTLQNLINSNKKPIELFNEWYEEAKKSEINDPNAMNLASISKDGKPNSRIVLLKSYDERGFVFYTNSNSKKGKSISSNTNIALNFHWKSLNRQIRIEGEVSIISQTQADEYYDSRPVGSRIGAWASLQSEELSDRKKLIDRVQKFERKFTNNDIPRPPHWNGYIVKPNLIEFWQEMPFRLHDRVEYKKVKDNWVSKKLYP